MWHWAVMLRGLPYTSGTTSEKFKLQPYTSAGDRELLPSLLEGACIEVSHNEYSLAEPCSV